MDKKALKNMTVEQLDKIYAALPYSNPFKDEVAKEIEGRLASDEEDSPSESKAKIEKAYQDLLNL